MDRHATLLLGVAEALLVAAGLVLATPRPTQAQNAMVGMQESMPASTRLGVVSFTTSCRPKVKADFNRGIALLHSFWYTEAERAFEKVVAADPDCAMAYWGEALLAEHQIQGEPIPTDIAIGGAALAKADRASEKSAREVRYIRALHLFYDGYRPQGYFVHAQRYSDALGALSAAYPSDLEAKVFYALSLLAADPPDDAKLTYPKKALAILLLLFKSHPDHPGIAHYIIHACDNPQMAKEGLAAARHYALIAPDAPHALHMPGHIFARLGLWRDDIRSNLASKAASEKAGLHTGAESRLHAMEFLEYAYLQIGHDEEAHAIVEEAKTVKLTDVDPAFPSYYFTVQARYSVLYAIETQNWALAKGLTSVAGAGPGSDGLIALAHAVAAGHLRDGNAGSKAAKDIDGLTTRGSRHDEIHAWADFSQGDLNGAVALLRPVAEQQEKVGKDEVDLPAREMLADMLFLSGRTAEALKEYQTSLMSDPNRFNALMNAGLAAERLGNDTLASRYYRTLLANCVGASGNALTTLSRARMFLLRTNAH